MKRILYILLAGWLFLLGAASCTDEEMGKGQGHVLPNGDIRLNVTANIPVPRQVITRDIDPDGLGVNTLWLFCFNGYGEYIGRREAGNFAPSTDKGEGYYTFDVEIPGSTRIIHFLSNVYLNDFNDRDNYGRNETTVIPAFVSASGRMCYWGRKQFVEEGETGETLDEFAAGGNVTLYRNQARVRWDLSEAPEGMEVNGYTICNRRAWGTLAPFNPTATAGQEFNFDLENPYITEPAEEYQMLATDPTTVNEQSGEEGDPHYIFENPNTLDAPVYAIMHIRTSADQQPKYYKIMFVDDTKDQLPIYRNYEYVIRITGLPQSMGYDSFDEAKEGIAANNAWVSVDPEIPSLSDGDNTLNIPDGTTQMFTTGGDKTIAFTYTGEADVHVEWLEDGVNVSNTQADFTHTEEDNYEINITLNSPTSEAQVGTLLLRTGEFTRQIKVYLMQPFDFNPVWVSTGVPMDKGERMSMTFVIPDNYPAELFPLECKISTNKMNANSQLSGELPIIMENTDFNIDGTLVSTTWGYKYVYIAEEPGIQEVFFTLNTSDGTDQGVTWNGGDCPYGDEENPLYEEYHGHVFLQADNFNDAHRLVLFQEGNSNRFISITGSDNNNPGFREMGVPPTVNQPIEITVNFNGGIPTTGTVMRIAATSVEPAPADQTEQNLYLDEADIRNAGLPTSEGIVHYYYIRPITNSHTLHFVTTSSDVEDLIRFSIDQEDGMNNGVGLYKSGGVKLMASPERFAFEDFEVYDDNRNVEGVKYGLEQPIFVSFRIPQEAVQYTDISFLLETQNMTPAPTGNTYALTAAEGGYRFTIPQGTDTTQPIVLHFLTTRIANGETVTLNATGNEALFESQSATFSNTPIRGTLTLEGTDAPVLNERSFITLERENGTRVGIITVESMETNNVANYRIELRPEYDFTMDETLTIYYNSLETPTQRIYQDTTTFQVLVNDATDDGRVELITLRPQ